MFSHNMADELYRHEYPMISAAYRTAEDEEPLFDPSADKTTLILSDRAQFSQMVKWGDNPANRVRQAVEIEMKRFGKKEK